MVPLWVSWLKNAQQYFIPKEADSAPSTKPHGLNLILLLHNLPIHNSMDIYSAYKLVTPILIGPDSKGDPDSQKHDHEISVLEMPRPNSRLGFGGQEEGFHLTCRNDGV